jgi:uncharacterized glyoxalase superfamily protein PhnB
MANHIFPSLRYRDAAAAADWLERAFGFERAAAHEDEDGRLVHVEMRWDDSMIMFGQETDAGIDRYGAHAGQGWSYVTVEDTDAHYTRAVAAGAEILHEPADTDYGSRDYSARDPEGNLWSFGTYDPLGA